MPEQLALQLRDEALDLLKQRRRQYVIHARNIAISIINHEGQVTVDRLREYYPPPADFDARVLGAVLADKKFEPVGYTPTTRPTSHHRPIRVFRLRDDT